MSGKLIALLVYGWFLFRIAGCHLSLLNRDSHCRPLRAPPKSSLTKGMFVRLSLSKPVLERTRPSTHRKPVTRPLVSTFKAGKAANKK